MKPIFLWMGICASSPAFAVANFSGHWVATEGKVSSNLGLSDTCSRVEIVIDQNAERVLTQKYKSTCRLYGSEWGPITDEIRGGKIFEHDEEVGTITEDSFLTTVQDGSVAYAFNLKLVTGSDGQPVLRSYYGVRNGTGAIATEAELRKVP